MEYDEPHLLLHQSSSYLGQLVDQTGPITARKLRDIAFVAHQKKKGRANSMIFVMGINLTDNSQ